MNSTPPASEPMTDLARLLSGPEALANLARLLATLDAETQQVKRAINRGLGQEEFARANARVLALGSAQLILKSLQIYLAR